MAGRTDEAALVAALEAQIAELRDEVAERTCRRGALRLVAGAATARAEHTPPPTAPSTGLALGAVNREALNPTVVSSTAPGANMASVFTIDYDTDGIAPSFPAALGGWSGSPDAPHGVYGYANGAEGYAVVACHGGGGTAMRAVAAGTGSTGLHATGDIALRGSGSWTGVDASGESVGGSFHGATGVVAMGGSGAADAGVYATGRTAVWADADQYAVRVVRADTAALLLPTLDSVHDARLAPQARTDEHQVGEIDLDGTGALWLCVADGAPGTWRELGGPTSCDSFHVIAPTRVYDSRYDREPLHGGPLEAGDSRVVPVADARPAGEAEQLGVVPRGATAITCQVSVVDTAGSGFLSLHAADAAVSTSASISWWGPGQAVTNGTVVALDGARRIRVVAGGSAGAATHFAIDVTGYYR